MVSRSWRNTEIAHSFSALALIKFIRERVGISLGNRDERPSHSHRVAQCLHTESKQ